MLNFYHALARKLKPLQPLWLLLALASLVWLGYLLLLAPVALSQRWQLTATVCFAFSLNVMLLTLLFAEPATDGPATDFWSRLLNRLRYAGRYLLGCLVSVLFLLIVWLFLRIALGIMVPLLS
ncbi:hypothetical protein [Arsukibacterium sp. UBA3155]|uniref:hypothetical protein n=1 Tax=Arsukibacterium sp. UBA3155 TaxID=1946058 RepID=UPI0025C6DC3E|nr:hypothetical protein [Arsukibacterium sp. UBA3155]|tara:strand:- start:43043 stop:43411 length:369 start_codon:yes stop_codon:yes gene_type:complete